VNCCGHLFLQEEKEEALRQLRKNLVVRAKPMPSFYQEGPPPKVELKKVLCLVLSCFIIVRVNALVGP
jgi:hypothetical protein